MAAQYTAGLSVGQVLTAATMNSIGAAWETYTPVWTANTTNPVLGNGTISGRYCRIQKLAIVEIRLFIGSTTTFGVGAYRLSLPLTPLTNDQCFGSFIAFDASAGYLNYAVSMQSGAGLLFGADANGRGGWSPTVPFTWANADQFKGTIVYEVA